jgi:hypothetical protein
MHIEGTLEKYLKDEVFPRIVSPPFGFIEATKVSHQRPVYIYRDEISRAKIVGKYFKFGCLSLDTAWERAEREYNNLMLLRDRIGMKDNHYNIVAPLGRNKVLSALLVLEKAPGKTLDYYIAKSIYEGQTTELFYRLADLARFFVRLHRNSDSGRQVSPKLPQWYLDVVLATLKTDLPGYGSREADSLKSLASGWWNRDGMLSDHEVIVHGDATPTNFLFHRQKVTGIDLEKMKWADRCWDLGFIAAELKHHFMWRAGDGLKAEPYIGHFLWEYALAFGDISLFYRITRRLPLYMALGLLRIARNNWLNEQYRYQLIGEAKSCLK